MAERSQFWTTSTTGDGTTTITEAQTIEWFRDIMIPFASSGPNTTQGILVGLLGELAVTGTATPVSVAAGGAVVEGYYYKSDAAVTVAIPTPVAGTRIDRIVLRASHSTTRTVRITRIVGVEASGSPPAITQTAGTTWDIKLAQVSITTGGVITVTDERSFCRFATLVDKSRVDGGTPNRIPFFSALGKLTDDADLTFDGTIFSAVGTMRLNGVDVPQVTKRQGGDAVDWSAPGTTTYTPNQGTSIQLGSTSFSSASSGTITFPSAFVSKPLVIPVAGPSISTGASVSVNNVTTTTFTWVSTSAITALSWIAIGRANEP